MQTYLLLGEIAFFNGRSNKLETNPVQQLSQCAQCLHAVSFNNTGLIRKLFSVRVLKPLVVCNFSLSFYYCLIMYFLQMCLLSM